MYKYVLGLLTILSVSTANAALLIEPVVGYNVASKFEISDATVGGITIPGESYSGGMGGAFGGRLGYQNLGFQLGIDYLRSSIDMDDKDFDENISVSEWAGFVGFEFPVLLRVYAGYIFSATGETESNKTKMELSEGSGVKFGVGFTGLPFIDINLEFRRGTFGELEIGGQKTGTETDYSSYMIGLSLPFTI